jgi:hypothetical protein
MVLPGEMWTGDGYAGIYEARVTPPRVVVTPLRRGRPV